MQKYKAARIHENPTCFHVSPGFSMANVALSENLVCFFLCVHFELNWQSQGSSLEDGKNLRQKRPLCPMTKNGELQTFLVALWDSLPLSETLMPNSLLIKKSISKSFLPSLLPACLPSILFLKKTSKLSIQECMNQPFQIYWVHWIPALFLPLEIIFLENKTKEHALSIECIMINLLIVGREWGLNKVRND